MVKVTKVPANLFTAFYESVQAMRAAEQRLLEAGEDYHDHGYVDGFVCLAGDGLISDHRHAYHDPFDGRIWHSRGCYEEWEAMQ